MGRLSNNQKAFNIVYKHFVTKKAKQSVVGDEYEEIYWALRGPYNRKDSIGLLLSDDQYNSDMEKLSLDELLKAYPEVQLVTKDTTLLKELQWAHDIAVQNDKEFSERIAVRLRGIAEEFNLEVK